MDTTRPTTRALNVTAKDITEQDVSSTQAVIQQLFTGETGQPHICAISRCTGTPYILYIDVYDVVELDWITPETVTSFGRSEFTVRRPRSIEEAGFLSLDWTGVWRHRGPTQLVITMKPTSPPTERPKRGGPAKSRLEIYRAAGLIKIFAVYGRLRRDCEHPAELPGEDAKSA